MANEQSKGADASIRGAHPQETERPAMALGPRRAEVTGEPEIQAPNATRPRPQGQDAAGQHRDSQNPSDDNGGRRAAETPRRQIAANDDLPSIGGLIYALQQRPSRSTFMVALVSSIIWLLLSTTIGWSLLNNQISEVSGVSEAFTSPNILAFVATIIIPIVLFWFLALLIWRAQELRLMASAMTEVAVRLAEPDQMAEQSVASVGQTIRRQVAAMNDAISRALGRAGELEALVHNELAALERSYGENELRIRGLIEELTSEREALANNSERVSQALTGIGNRVSRDITMAGEQATKALASATTTLADTLAAKGDKITAAVSAAGTAVDTRLAERGAQVTEQLVGQGRAVAEKLDGATRQVAQMLQETTKHVTASIEANRDTLFQSLSNVSERIESEVPLLLERLDKEQSQLSSAINEASQSITALETAVAQGTGNLNATLHEHSNTIQSVFTQKTQMLDSLLAQKAQAIEHALGHRSEAITSTIAERIKALDSAFTQQSGQLETKMVEHTQNLGAIMTEGMETVRSSTELMNQHSDKATSDLSTQAENLRGVSKGLLDQIHSLTQRFDNQGQAIMSAAQALDSSNSKIDSILQRRHEEITGLLDSVGTKAQDLDKMMLSYSDLIENSLVKTESRAKQIGDSLSQQTETHSKEALAQIEHLRAEARERTEKAVGELKGNFEHITGVVNQQLTHLTTQFGRTAHEVKEQTQRTATELETTREALHRRMRDLPNETKENAEAVKQVLSEQIKALGTLSALATETNALDDISRPGDSARLVSRDNSSAADAQRPALTVEPRQAPAAIAPPPAAIPANPEFQRQPQVIAPPPSTAPAPAVEQPRAQQPAAQPASAPRPPAAQQPSAPLPVPPGGNQGRFSYVDALGGEGQPVRQRQILEPPRAAEAKTVQDPRPVIQQAPAAAQPAGQPRPPQQATAAPQASPPAPSNGAAAAPRPAASVQTPDLASVTAHLAQKLSIATPREEQAQAAPASSDSPKADGGRGSWSLGDLLARASEPEDESFKPEGADLGPAPQFLQSRQERAPAHEPPPRPQPQPSAGVQDSTGGDPSGALRLDDLANAIDHNTAVEVWQRFRQGDRGVLSKQLYSHEGQAAFDEINQRYQSNGDFRTTVDRYIGDFERLLKEAETKDPSGSLLQNYLSSETGRVYLMLAHASGRLR